MISFIIKLNGIFLKKAELEKDFERVYLKIFERIFEINEFDVEDCLTLLGDVGG